MKTWTVADAKRDFARGLLSSAWIERNPMASTWCVWIKGQLAQDGQGVLIDAHNKEARDFKTIDAAVRAIEGIGFEVNRLVVGLKK
jgi:hypothetical protein